MLDDKHVTWYPSYGAEMRGGTVNCEVVMNEVEDVSSVNKAESDFIVALNQASFDRFLKKIKKGGWMIANSTLVKELKPRADINYIFAPVSALADKLGNVKMANILSLGVLAKISKLVSLETLEKALDVVIPAHRKNLLPLNIKALKLGYDYELALAKI